MAGKHRAVTNTGRYAATTAAFVTVGAALSVGNAPTASAQTLPPDAIAQCESGGSLTVQNKSSSASGKWQFIDGTWRAYGGAEFAPRAYMATEREQDIVAARAFAAEGTTPWNASKSCWGGKSSASSSVAAAPKVETPRQEPRRQAAPEAALTLPEPVKVDSEVNVAVPTKPVVTIPEGSQFTPGGDGDYTVVSGDTISELALRFGVDENRLGAKNADIVENLDWIFVGEKLHSRL